MATNKTVNGVAVTPVPLKGKDYITVADRVRVAHETAKDQQLGFQIVNEHVNEILGRAYITVTIDVGGHRFMGTSEIRIETAKNGSADKTDPFECAETSAIGRALGFAGFGMIDSIASADDMARVVSSETKREAAARAMKEQQQQSNSTVSEDLATDRQIANIQKLCKALNRPDPEYTDLTFTAAKEIIANLSNAYIQARRQPQANIPQGESPIDEEPAEKTYNTGSVYLYLQQHGYMNVASKEDLCKLAIGRVPGATLTQREAEMIRDIVEAREADQAEKYLQAQDEEKWPFDR